MRPGAPRSGASVAVALGSQAVGWFFVVVIATATTTGLLKRFLVPDDAPYLRVTQVVADHPVWSVLLFVLVLAAYVVGFRRLCRLLDSWRDGLPVTTPGEGRPARWAAFVDRTFSSWRRIALTLGVAWLFFYLTSFPGQPSPDLANMVTEFLKHRSDFDVSPTLAPADRTAPYEGYPTSFYLLPDGDGLWSNHHPFYLMQAYGTVTWLSLTVFDSLLPGLMLMSAASLVLTLVAFGRGLFLVGRYVPSWKHRGIALAVVVLTPLIPVWSMAPHKNQLFSAAFVWWLGLLVEKLRGPDDVPRRWYVETAFVSLLIAISVAFGWIVLAVEAVALMLVSGHRIATLLTIALPGVAVTGSLMWAVSTGAVIPSDPIETQGVQLQQLALTLREHPDALTPEEHEVLSRIFDLDVFVDVFDPDTADPLKSSGPMIIKTMSFRYKTVQPEDWAELDRIWLDVGKRYPDTYVDATFLKSYRYLDPFDEGTNWYPPWSYEYERMIDGHRAAPVGFNKWPRAGVRGAAYGCMEVLPCRPFIATNTRTVIVVLLCAAAIAVRRRHAWIWALPCLLQVAIAGASPLSAGGRYTLGLTYVLGLLILMLCMADDPDEDREGPGQLTSRSTV